MTVACGKTKEKRNETDMEDAKKFDVVLLETEGVRGLTATDIKTMTALLKEDEFYPLSKDSTKLERGVVGFVGIYAAKAIDYEYATLRTSTAKMAKASTTNAAFA